MNDYQEIATHYYDQISPQMQGMVGEAFQLQKADLLGHIAAAIEKSGEKMALFRSTDRQIRFSE